MSEHEPLQPHIEVLLSTYNGEQYVAALLESVLAQECEGSLTVRVRDDGSQDRTLDIVRGVEDPRILVDAGPNLGATGSFFRLLESSSKRADYVAFADQDDVWLPGKLAAAVERHRERAAAGPALYCGRATITDAHLQPLGETRLPELGPSTQNALVENIATGCTSVLDAKARDLLVRHGWPRVPISHDRWCYLVLATLGTVLYDERSFILYRQHGANTIGVDVNRAVALFHRVRRAATDVRSSLGSSAGRYRSQAREFLRLYGAAMSAGARHDVERFASLDSVQSRLGYAVTSGRQRQRLLDDVALRLGVVAGVF